MGVVAVAFDLTPREECDEDTDEDAVEAEDNGEATLDAVFPP